MHIANDTRQVCHHPGSGAYLSSCVINIVKCRFGSSSRRDVVIFFFFFFTIGLNSLKGLSQPKWVYDSMILNHFRKGGNNCCLLYLCQPQREVGVLLLSLLGEESWCRGPWGPERTPSISNLGSQTATSDQLSPIHQWQPKESPSLQGLLICSASLQWWQNLTLSSLLRSPEVALLILALKMLLKLICE